MKMRRLVFPLALVLLAAGTAHAGLDAYLHSLNVMAQGDIGGFRAEVGARLDASGPQLDLVFRSVDEPAHAALCLWLAQQSHQPVDVVVKEYRRRRGQGWGALAKSLGIKPGSPAFHDLKQGDLGWQPTGTAGGKGKGQASGKRKKGKGRGRS